MNSAKCAAIMSVPRTGFCDTFGCIYDGLGNIPLYQIGGVFWGQSLQRGLEEMIQHGLDWALVIDYDSMFTQPQVQHLLRTFAHHPEYDALAPVQVRRESDVALFKPRAVTTESGMLVSPPDEQIIPAKTAHFGLTVLRLAALKDMPKPWFVAKPDADGSWNDGRIDEDIGFWLKFGECGKKLGVLKDCRIGHLELMVTEFDENFNVVHVPVSEWKKRRSKATLPVTTPNPPTIKLD